MIIERSEDYDAIRAVLTHPDIWETISGDNEHPERFEVPKGENVYLLGYNNEQVVGLSVLHLTDGKWFNHFQVLPEFRKEHAIDFANKAFEWFWNNTEINKLYALIPVIYPNVKRFAEISGYKEIDVIKDSQARDEWLMMIERGE